MHMYLWFMLRCEIKVLYSSALQYILCFGYELCFDWDFTVYLHGINLLAATYQSIVCHVPN